MSGKKSWSRGDKSAAGALLVGVVAIGVGVAIPEVRRALHLEKPTPPAVVLPPIKPAEPATEVGPPQTQPVPNVRQQAKSNAVGKGNVAGNNVAGNGNVVGNNNQIGNTAPTVQVNAPNGIAIGGGNVTNPTVNNYAPPQRTMTAAQRATFVSVLKQTCPFEVAVRGVPGNAESMEYASQLGAAIQEAGCTLRRPRFLIDTTAGYGVWVMLHDKNNTPSGADALMDAFSKAGTPAKAGILDALEQGVIYLMVEFNDADHQ
jgi:hypothetical protein